MQFKNDWADRVYVLIESFTQDEFIYGCYDHVRQIVCGSDLQEAGQEAERTGFLEVFIDPAALVIQLQKDMTITLRDKRDVYMLSLITDADQMYHEIIQVFNMSRTEFNRIRKKPEIDDLLSAYNEACMALDFHMSLKTYKERMRPSVLINDICCLLKKEEAYEAKRLMESVSEEAFSAVSGFFLSNEGAPGPLVLFSEDTEKCAGIVKLFADHVNRFGPPVCAYLHEADPADSAEGQEVPPMKIILDAQRHSRTALQKAVSEMIMHGSSVIMTSDNPEIWTVCFENALSVKV